MKRFLSVKVETYCIVVRSLRVVPDGVRGIVALTHKLEHDALQKSVNRISNPRPGPKVEIEMHDEPLTA